MMVEYGTRLQFAGNAAVCGVIQKCTMEIVSSTASSFRFIFSVTYICCYKECNWTLLKCAANFCGCIGCGKFDNIFYTPFDTCYCCLPNESNSMYNCGGCCGIKDGDPVCLVPFVMCLKEGTGDRLRDSINNGKADWIQRTSKKGSSRAVSANEHVKQTVPNPIV